MGMPIEIEIVGGSEVAVALEEVFAYFVLVDEQFSPYKEMSEVSRMNRGDVAKDEASSEMREVLTLAQETKAKTEGYFDIRHPKGHLDPSGVVKGWAIKNAAAIIRAAGHEDFMVNAGGDIATGGKNAEGGEWNIGIRNPFNIHEIVKVVYPRGKGVATSGSYIRGPHIYNPHAPGVVLDEVVSVTVIGSDVLEADLMATAAFAMGKRGIIFIENLPGFEGYQIDKGGIATMTTGFGAFVAEASA